VRLQLYRIFKEIAWGLAAYIAVKIVEKRINLISFKIEYGNFPRQIL